MPTRTHLPFAALVLAFLASIIGCRSSNQGIQLQGFHSEKLGAHVYRAEFEAEGMSHDDAQRNLMFHIAKMTIDDGMIWFSTEEVSAEKKVTTEKAPGAVPQTHDATPRAYTPEDMNATSFTIGSKIIVSTLVTTYHDKPSGVKAFEASKVLEELGNVE